MLSFLESIRCMFGGARMEAVYESVMIKRAKMIIWTIVN